MSGKSAICFGLSLLLTPITWAAVDCSSKSLRFEQQGDQYWAIEPVKAKDSEQKQFIKAMEGFSGRIVGSLSREECAPEEDKIKVLSTDGRLKGTLTTSDNGVKLNFEVTDTKVKTVKPELLEFLGRSPTTEFHATANGYTVLQKVRARAKPGDKISLLREAEYSISFSKNELIIDAQFFANGQFYATNKWVFKRR